MLITMHLPIPKIGTKEKKQTDMAMRMYIQKYPFRLSKNEQLQRVLTLTFLLLWLT